jgi:glycosyltransferase involved in cell wall biosynthesis
MSDFRHVGLSVFFPAYNDAQALPELLERTFQVVSRLTPNYEVLIVNDGSTDGTASVLESLASLYSPHLKIVTHETNRGYGAALRSGFAACTKDLVFYTDGDGQYDVRELEDLWNKMRPGVDFVNGYKLARGDGWARLVIGKAYNCFVRWVFDLQIRDVNCDFRLIRRSVLDRIQLYSDTGSICVELIKNLQSVSSGFEEAGVHHYPRKFGRSTFLRTKSVLATFNQLLMLYRRLSFEPPRDAERVNS